MPTHQTMDQALRNLVYATMVVRLRQKLNSDFIQHEKELTYLQENCDDIDVQKVIDRYSSRYSEDFFDEDRV